MKSLLNIIIIGILLVGGTILISYNRLISAEEYVSASWSQVLNQYERRADLIPNLVATVKGYSSYEVDTFLKIVEARSKAVQPTIDLPDNATEMKKFIENQDKLSGALSRLMVLVEQYPELKANENFLALQSQLEGTENRIAVARRDYIDAVRQYNTRLRTMPTCWIAEKLGDFQPKATFDIPIEKASLPEVVF